MDVFIYDHKDLHDRTWYLAKCNLAEYLRCLKKDFFDFEIQRRIVKNIYLDGILRTIE